MQHEWNKEAKYSRTFLQNVRSSLLFAAFALLLAGCNKTQPAPPQTPVTFAYTYQPQSTLARIAVHEGYFTEEGLKVTPQLHTYGRAALEAVLAGGADFATVAETPVMFNILKGEKIYVIATIDASTKNIAIVARRDAGIAQVADLKGKRVGYIPGTTSEFFLHSFLIAHGIPQSAIHPVPMKPEEMQAAIAQNRVDAICIWNYVLTLAENQLGANGISFYDPNLYTETFNIAARQDYINTHPDVARRFISALVKAEKFAAEHPAEAQAIVAADLKTDPAIVKSVWDKFGYHVEISPMLMVTLEDETRWAMKAGLAQTAPVPNYQQYLYLDALASVRPQAVLINR